MFSGQGQFNIIKWGKKGTSKHGHQRPSIKTILPYVGSGPSRLPMLVCSRVKVDLIFSNEARRGPQNKATNGHILRPSLMMLEAGPPHCWWWFVIVFAQTFSRSGGLISWIWGFLVLIFKKKIYILERFLVIDILLSNCWVDCFVFLLNVVQKTMSWVLMDLGYTWGDALGVKKHNLVGNGHKVYLPVRSVSCDKERGGGGDSRLRV